MMKQTIYGKTFFRSRVGFGGPPIMGVRMRFSIEDLQRVQCICIHEHSITQAEHLQDRDAKHEVCSLVTGQIGSSTSTLQIRNERARTAYLKRDQRDLLQQVERMSHSRVAFHVYPARKSKKLPLLASSVVVVESIVCDKFSRYVEADARARLFP